MEKVTQRSLKSVESTDRQSDKCVQMCTNEGNSRASLPFTGMINHAKSDVGDHTEIPGGF